MADYRLISGDSHFVEPPDTWTVRMDKKFRDRAPHTVRNLDGREGEFWVYGDDIPPIGVAGFFAAGVPAQDLPNFYKRGFEAAPKSVWDPAARLKDQDLDGVEAEVIYTSFGMPLFSLTDAELRAACFRAFNDWAADYCSHDLKRLVPLGLISLEDIPGAAAELNRIAKKGMRGAMIWAEPPDDRPYSHPDYEPFWAAAQELDMPLSLHLGTGMKGHQSDAMKHLVFRVATIHQAVERSLVVLVCDGVLEKFPNLKIVSAEHDVGWMPYLMQKMDKVQAKFSAVTGMKLSLRASEYIKRQVFATFIDDDLVVDVLHHYEPDNIMWSSDYPHTAATFPHSREYVDKLLGAVAEPSRRKVVRDTAARLYGLE